MPEFAIHNRNPDGTVRVPYDLEELTGIEQRAVATITRSTGWRGRGTFGDAVTSYYTMCRFLRFEEFKIGLRETVASTINRILAVAGAAVRFKGVVSLHHLPTLEEVAASRSDLVAGRLDFVKIAGAVLNLSTKSCIPPWMRVNTKCNGRGISATTKKPERFPPIGTCQRV